MSRGGVRRHDGATVAIGDEGAPVTADTPGFCGADGAHRMTCAVTTATSYAVDLGDGDDRLEFDGVDATLRGGPGNDEMTSRRTRGGKFAILGGPGDDRLVSGPLGEELYGDAGDDTLEGGEESDRLDGGTGNDRMDGGAGGFDSVEYSTRTADVRVHLGSGTAGAGDERDTVANVESAFTGTGTTS